MKKKIFEELSKDYRKICKGSAKIITDEFIKNFPKEPGVYIFYKNGKPIYVGRANNLKKRLKSHLSQSKTSSSSSFRRKIERENKNVSYPNTRKYIMNKMKLFYLKLNTSNVYAYSLLLEAFLIMQWRSRKQKLVNCNFDLGEIE